MELPLWSEASKIWTGASKVKNNKQLKFELEIHKKLLNLFQVGDYYYYIFNLQNSCFDFVSPEITNVLGYSPDEISVEFILENIHPEDQEWFLKFEHKAAEFFFSLSTDKVPNYKMRYDYRIKKKSGDYMRILQQVIPLEFDDNKNFFRTFGVHTDISSIKQEGIPTLSFIGLNGEPSYVNVAFDKPNETPDTFLTKREREILTLLTKGKKSEEIGQILFISKHTVDSHRKNLLQKTGCKNTSALVSMAVQKGWI